MSSFRYELAVRGGAVLIDEQDAAVLRGFSWKISAHGNGKHPYARAVMKVGGRWQNVLMHRYMLGLDAGDKRCVDHIDGNGLNNCRSNLRICTRGKNSLNRGPTRGRLGFKGVQRQGGMFIAKISERDACVYLGSFPSAVEAAVEYDAAAAARFGEFHRPLVIPREADARNLIDEKRQLQLRIEEIDGVLKGWPCA